jgi:hypothetical protein
MIVETWDGNNINDGTNYKANLEPDGHALPDVSAYLARRNGYFPILSSIERPARRLKLKIFIINPSNKRVLQMQLHQWFDPDDETTKRLVVDVDAGGSEKYVNAICESLRHVPSDFGTTYEAVLAVDGDVRWRDVTTPSTPITWNITSGTGTLAVDAEGEDEAYPVITVEPTADGSTASPYKIFIPVRWLAPAAYQEYPSDIVNNALDTRIASTNFALANGDDLIVRVDGVDVDRWLDGPNTATTKVWVNLDFLADVSLTITAAIGSGDTVTTLDFNEDTTGINAAGIVLINSEIFTYTGKNDALKRVTGVTRAAKGTTAAAHSANDPAYWIQHDIFIHYGNASASTPALDDEKEPVFSLASSTNTSWVYADFGGDSLDSRPAAWERQQETAFIGFYGGDRATFGDPWAEIGIESPSNITARQTGRVALWNPCGVTNANFTNGEKYIDKVSFSSYLAYVQARNDSGVSWQNEYTITKPSASATWQSWSQSVALSNRTYVALYLSVILFPTTGTEMAYLEAADCTVTLDSSNTPVVSIGAEQGNFNTDIQLTNLTTAESIKINYLMALNDEIEIDTDNKTVIDIQETTSQLQALTVTEGVRKHWFKFIAGTNNLKFSDLSGTSNFTVTIDYDARSYI